VRLTIWLVAVAAVGFAVDYSSEPLTKENIAFVGTIAVASLVLSFLQDIKEIIRE